MFVEVQVGADPSIPNTLTHPVVGQPRTLTWLMNTGAIISQINSRAARAFRPRLKSVGWAKIRCSSAMSIAVIDMQVCVLQGCCVVEPSSRQRGLITDTQAGSIEPEAKPASLHNGADHHEGSSANCLSLTCGGYRFPN